MKIICSYPGNPTTGEPGCPRLIDKGTRGGRCNQHQAPIDAQRRAERGTTTEQGLGWDHQQNAAQLKQAALGTHCPDCGQLMTDLSQMVADHSKARSRGNRGPADRVHCRTCSNKQGGRLSHRT